MERNSLAKAREESVQAPMYFLIFSSMKWAKNPQIEV